MSNPVPSTLTLANIADGANIVASDHRNNYTALQLSVNALIAALSGGTANQVLTAVDSTDVQWGEGALVYRKASAKAVNTTIADTDLLNGEITVAAGKMSTNKTVRLTAFGDLVNNTGSGTDIPIFSLKFGGTTLLKTAVATPGSGSAIGTSATRYGWRIVCEIMNLGAANAQWATMDGKLSFLSGTTGTAAAAFTTGEGAVVLVNAGSATKPAVALIEGGNSGAVDTTAGCALALSVINPSNSANFETKLFGAIIEVV